MKTRSCLKLVHEGHYVAEVDVELLETDDDWSPSLSLKDAYRLDDVRESLRNGDIKAATQYGKVYTLTPVTS